MRQGNSHTCQLTRCRPYIKAKLKQGDQSARKQASFFGIQRPTFTACPSPTMLPGYSTTASPSFNPS